MNDNARKWLAELRSGTYKQIKGQWCNGIEKSECCALGILVWQQRKGLIDGLKSFSEWFGLPKEDPRLLTITSLNDMGKSFEYIADWCEQNLFQENNNGR